MVSKTFYVFCASAIVIQSISAQCIGNALAAEELALGAAGLAFNPGLAANALAYGASPFGAYGNPVTGFGLNLAPTSGGGFPVKSVSPISPTGISVVSENAMEGALTVVGELPFLGAIALEGALPSIGAGGINYGCGNGAIGIISEGISPAYGSTVAQAAGPIAPGRFGYGPTAGATGFAAPGLAAPGFGAYGFNGMAGYGGMY